MLTQTDFLHAANLIGSGCKPAHIMAVDTVESGGKGFYNDGRLVILFEPHIFWKELKKAGIDPVPHQKAHPGLLNPVWDRMAYGIGGTSWEKLALAKTIHKEAALKACSWGRYQVLGQNHQMVGFATAQAMVDDMQKGEAQHLEIFVRYIKAAHLDDELVHQDWAGFARGYNGPLYFKNNYDKKLEKAFAAAQAALTHVG